MYKHGKEMQENELWFPNILLRKFQVHKGTTPSQDIDVNYQILLRAKKPVKIQKKIYELLTISFPEINIDIIN